MKILPVGAELLRADGRTDAQTEAIKLTVAFLKIMSTYLKNSKITFTVKEQT